jgi:hypothetical protein
MSQEFRNIRWNGRPPVIEPGEAVRFELDGEEMAGIITSIKGREVAENGKVRERGQVTFSYEDISGMKLKHTTVGPK